MRVRGPRHVYTGKARGWEELPESDEVWEVLLPQEFAREGEPKPYYGLVCRNKGSRRLILCSRKSLNRALAEEREGCSWVRDRFPVPDGVEAGAFRLKALDLSRENFRLYVSQNNPAIGHTIPRMKLEPM